MPQTISPLVVFAMTSSRTYWTFQLSNGVRKLCYRSNGASGCMLVTNALLCNHRDNGRQLVERATSYMDCGPDRKVFGVWCRRWLGVLEIVGIFKACYKKL